MKKILSTPFFLSRTVYSVELYERILLRSYTAKNIQVLASSEYFETRISTKILSNIAHDVRAILSFVFTDMSIAQTRNVCVA